MSDVVSQVVFVVFRASEQAKSLEGWEVKDFKLASFIKRMEKRGGSRSERLTVLCLIALGLGHSITGQRNTAFLRGSG